jgi:hypothetical protein
VPGSSAWRRPVRSPGTVLGLDVPAEGREAAVVGRWRARQTDRSPSPRGRLRT